MLSDKPSRIYSQIPDGGWSFNALGYSPETTERSFQKKLNGIEPVFSSPAGAIQKIREPLFPNTLSTIPFQVARIGVHDAGGKVIETQGIGGGGSTQSAPATMSLWQRSKK